MASLPLDLLRDAGARLDARIEASASFFTGAVTALGPTQPSASAADNLPDELAGILADLQRLSPSSVPLGQDIESFAFSLQGSAKGPSRPVAQTATLDLAPNRPILPDGASTVSALQNLRQIFQRLERVSNSDDVYAATATGAQDALERLSAIVHALVLQALLAEAHASRERGWAWRTVYDESRTTLWYFAQTLPVRCFSAVRQLASLVLLPLRHELAPHTLPETPDAPHQPPHSREKFQNTLELLKRQPAVLLFALFPWSVAQPGTGSKGLGAPTPSIAYRMGSAGIDLRSVLRSDSDQRVMGLPSYLANVASKGQGLDGQVARSLGRATREVRRVLLTPGSLLSLPLRLIRDEARAKERALKDHTRELAIAIGYAAAGLQAVGSSQLSTSNSSLQDPFATTLSQAEQLQTLVLPPQPSSSASIQGAGAAIAALNSFENVLTTGFGIAGSDPQGKTQTTAARSLGLYTCSPLGLSAPALFSRVWIKLLGYPLVGYATYRLASANQTTLKSAAWGAWDTAKGLVVNWIWQPVANFVRTLQRGSGEAQSLTAPLSLESDQASLARMVTAFAQDMDHHRSAASAVTSGLTQEQIGQMAQRVKMGDLSPVMTVYEERLKSPIYNLLTGSLIRPALIQLQKAKVDLELAMNGIDRLLASQQLVLGAVGLSPALGILYIAQSWIRTQLSGVGQGSARARAEAARFNAWQAVRGIEAALLALPGQSTSLSDSMGDSAHEAAYVHGTLLLDLTALRAVGPSLINACSTARNSRAARKALLHDLVEDIRRLERASPLALSTHGKSESVQDSRHRALIHLRHTWGSLINL